MVAAVEKQIVETLRGEGQPLTWDELEDKVDYSEDELEEAIITLVEKRLLRHRPREGDYKLTELPDESECAICGGEIEPGRHFTIKVQEQGVVDPDIQTVSVHATCKDRVMGGFLS